MDIATVLTSSAVATGVTFFINLGLKAFDTGKTAKNNALYAAIVLEEWVVGCFNVMADVGDYHQTEGQLGRPHNKLPELINFRKEIDLSSINLKLRGDLLTLYAKTNISNYAIEDELIQFKVHVTDDHATDRGIEAINLAERLRKKYGLPVGHEDSYRHAVKMLREAHSRLIERRAKHIANMAKMTAPSAA